MESLGRDSKSMTEMINTWDIKSMTLEELQEYFVKLGEKAFRAKQVYQWMHEKLASSYDEMSNISKDLREKLQSQGEYTKLNMVQVQESAKKLSDEFRSAVPELPWRELRALRNVIVHQYDEIEPFALYESATRDAAVLLTQLTPYVEAIED